MKTVQTKNHSGEFEPLIATPLGQAAMMTLAAGAASDEKPSNEHPASQQWLYVIAGKGAATIIPLRGRRRTVKLLAGMLLLIERGELHQIRNTSSEPLRTLNFYLPPAYRADGRLLKRRKPSRT